MSVEWTTHALERAAERGVSPTAAPIQKILRLWRLVAEGEEFHVNEFLYTWICKRDADSVVILTVIYNTR